MQDHASQEVGLHLLAGLNPQQQDAVRTTSGPVLVIAGAGSGKTTVLTRRIAWLLAHDGVLPHSVLAITFTNKAAKEMRERVSRLVGAVAYEMWVATFHAACVRILRKEIGVLGYASSFTILDAIDQLSVVRRVCEELNIDTKRYDARGLHAAISNYKNAFIGASEARAQARSPFEQRAADVYERYDERLRAQNALDFDDLIAKTVELLQSWPDVLTFYQRKFQYILVDEYQDTNRAQYLLVRLLALRTRNLCVVGDSDQSIYRWRGADIANILSFEKDYPDAKTIRLEQNYRSTDRILRAANAVIENNLQRPQKTLWTAKVGGDPVHIIRAGDEQDEGRQVVAQIARLRKDGTQYADMAVLYRTNAQSRAIEEAFMSVGVPYRVFGGIRFYERKEIKDVLAWLRLVANADDDTAFLRVVNVPRRGVGEGTLGRLQEQALAMRCSLFAALEAPELLGIAPRFVDALLEFASLIRRFAAQAAYLDLTELVTQVLEQSGYRAMLAAERTIEAQARLENVEELLTVTREFDAREDGGGLEAFLAEVALVSDAEQAGGNAGDGGDAVSLMTLHSAKGLEFPVVFLVGMEEGVFPHSRSLQEPEEMEEERRLCYVGITRAKDQLYVSHARMRTLYGQSRTNPPSRFLAELPADVVEDVAPAVPVAKRMAPAVAGRLQVPASFGANPSVSWVAGDRAHHRKWGAGVVVDTRGAGEDMEVVIRFGPPVGERTLMVRFAPIEKVEGSR
ncbi:MAG: DNA helicase PcrA [Firmicutes bacterium]|nr:DNA helicase PcrA [Bacillota bacterium]